MAIIRGHIAQDPEKRVGKNDNVYYNLRVAENYGRDESRKSVFVDVVASITELEADLLPKGSGVEIDGRLELEAYISKRKLEGAAVPTTWDGVIALLKSRGALVGAAKLITNSKGCNPYQFEKKQAPPQGADQSPPAGAGEAQGAGKAAPF